MKNKLRLKEGFTIIELIVVVAILGALVLLAGPKLLGYVEKAELTRIQHDVKVMEHEMKLAIIDEEVEIAHWGNNKKNLGALIMQDKLFEKEGAAERIDARHLLEKEVSNVAQSDSNLGMGGDLIPVESENILSVDETYKIIPTEYKDVIGTRLSGMFYTNDLGKVYYEHDKPIKGGEEKEKTLDCPLPLLDYDFEPETGTIVKWHGTETHLVIPEAFRAEVNDEEKCVPVRIIGTAAFMQGNFKRIVIPQSVIRIEENAFKDNLLTEVTIPHSVKYIGSGAFVGNSFGSGGSNIIIRNTYGNVEIVPGAFGGYEPTYRSTSPKDLNMVFHPSSGTIISAGPSKSRVITIPETLSVGGIEYPVKQINKGAYQGLGLISVVLSSGLERIEDYAFAGNQLIGITIPSKVNHIGNYAFAFNEVTHSKTAHRKATIVTIIIKDEEQMNKVNQYGDIYENGTKIENYKGQDGSEVRLLNHIFVTSIGNHVIDEKYVGAIPGELEDNNDKGDSDNPSTPSSPIDEIIKGYENVVYIDSELTKALREAKAGDLIVLEEGVYPINSLLDIHGKYGVDILGQGANTVIEVNSLANLGGSIKNNIYRLTIQPSSSFVRYESLALGDIYARMTYDVTYNNVLFKDPYNRLIKNQRHSSYIMGDGSGGIAHNYKKLEFNNCVSIDMPIVTTWSDYYGNRVKPNVKIINSATNVNKLDSPNDEYGLHYAHDILIKTTSLENARFDDNYNIISHDWQSVGTGANFDGSQAHIGLYGGPFGW